MENHSLIERIKNHDSEKVIKEIYCNHRNEFLLWAMRNHSCSLEEAKDVFQQAVIIFYENIRSGKVSQITTQLKTYIFGIGKNKILEMLRTKRKMQAQYNDQTYLDNDEYYNEMDDNYEDNLKNVTRCLVKMGDPCKSILEQYYYHRKSMIEISEILEYKNSDTVKNLKYKCLQRLRQLLKKEFGEFNRQLA